MARPRDPARVRLPQADATSVGLGPRARGCSHGRVRRAPPWDCGYPLQTARMQDTAEGFGQPIREVFDVVFRIDRQLPTPFDTAPKYAVRVEDHFWYWLYLPLARVTDFVARQVGRIQQGRISVYLVYSFITLLALLFFVR